MNVGFVARVCGGLALSLATSLVPAAVSRDDGAARQTDRAVVADRLLRSVGTPTAEVAFQVTPPGALPLDRALFARVDGIDLASGVFVEASFAERAVGSIAATGVVDAANHLDLPLPQPGRFTAVLATLALGLFFFLRRIV